MIEWICYTGCIASAIACYLSERHDYKKSKNYELTLAGCFRILFTVAASWLGLAAVLGYHASDIVIIKKK